MHLTFRQYTERERATLKREYAVNAADMAELYGDVYERTVWLPEWVRACEAAASAGCRLPDAVLDDFCERFGAQQYLTTFRGRAEQEGYLPPSVRKAPLDPAYAQMRQMIGGWRAQRTRAARKGQE